MNKRFEEIEQDLGEKFITVIQRRDAYKHLMEIFREEDEKEWEKKATFEYIIFSLTATTNPRERFIEIDNFLKLSEEIKGYLSERVEKTLNPLHQSRYYDILWDKWKDARAGIQAISAYLEVSKIHIKKKNILEAEDALHRAIKLTHVFKKYEFIDEIKNVAFEFIKETHSNLGLILNVKNGLYSLRKYFDESFRNEIEDFLRNIHVTETDNDEGENKETLKEQAELHTPEELLINAQSFLAYNNESMLRACVLEAITALEAYVQKVVFDVLSKTLPNLLVKWIEDKTKMDFDTRISTLTSVALGQQIDKNDTLWSNYKEAKKLRNAVTHSGRKVTREDALFVVNTVYEWLAFLGSRAEVDLSLYSLKAYVEKKGIILDYGEQAVHLVFDYYKETKAATGNLMSTIKLSEAKYEADLILRFGQYKILIETKLIMGNIAYIEANKYKYINQVRNMLKAANIERGALIIFHKVALPEVYNKIESIDNDNIKIVYIKVQ